MATAIMITCDCGACLAKSVRVGHFIREMRYSASAYYYDFEAEKWRCPDALAAIMKEEDIKKTEDLYLYSLYPYKSFNDVDLTKDKKHKTACVESGVCVCEE